MHPGPAALWRTLSICCTLLCALALCSNIAVAAPSPELINALFAKVQSMQYTTSTPFDPPRTFYAQAGAYPSDVRLDLEGSELDALLREEFRVPDANPFVTNFALQILLESYSIAAAHTDLDASALLPSNASIAAALSSLASFHDKNRPGSGAIMFWPQIVSPTNASVWMAWPYNLVIPLTDLAKGGTVLEDILAAMGLSKYAGLIIEALSALNVTEDAFHIPSDFDDSALNVLLGTLLFELGDAVPEGYAAWAAANPPLSAWASLFESYAYAPLQPSSANGNGTFLDPRVYYVAHEFFEAAAAAGNTELRLIPTWIASLEETRALAAAGVAMPFNVQNTDASVCANNVVAMTRTLLSGLDSTWFGPTQQAALVSSAEYIAWAFTSGAASRRPDLIFVYYPSVYDALWFVGRSVVALNSAPVLPFPQVLGSVAAVLTDAMRGAGTELLLANMTMVAGSQPPQGYWDDFLGDNDEILHRPIKRGEDRLFSTALAVNALIDFWTIQNASAFAWIDSVPPAVVDAVAAGAAFLQANAFSPLLKPWNVFFSGSAKGLDLPFEGFPSNFACYLNGSCIDPTTASPDAISVDLTVAMDGVVAPATYALMLERTYFNATVPPFDGWGADAGFPFWCAPVLTYAQIEFALVKVTALGM